MICATKWGGGGGGGGWGVGGGHGGAKAKSHHLKNSSGEATRKKTHLINITFLSFPNQNLSLVGIIFAACFQG